MRPALQEVVCERLRVTSKPFDTPAWVTLIEVLISFLWAFNSTFQLVAEDIRQQSTKCLLESKQTVIVDHDVPSCFLAQLGRFV